ncbi:MAG: hypothetical protein ACI35S_02930 [Anaeroplasma sp.]
MKKIKKFFTFSTNFLYHFIWYFKEIVKKYLSNVIIDFSSYKHQQHDIIIFYKKNLEKQIYLPREQKKLNGVYYVTNGV